MICVKSSGFGLPVLAVLAAVGLAGCKYMPDLPVVGPYRIDIQQGNYLSQEMVSQLKPGMTKEQVRFVLGTPLVTDIFHGERWDYVYYREVERGKREQRRLSVFFENNVLARVSGDVVPAGDKPAADQPAAGKPAAEKPPAAAEKKN